MITLLAIGSYAILRVAISLRRDLRERQEKVISRLIGLLPSAIGIQMLVGGLRDNFPVLAGAG